MAKQKYLITNLVYGEYYARLFCNNHLKSLLDPTNLPAIADKYDVEYVIFTDEATSVVLDRHPNMMLLSDLVTVSLSRFNWPRGVDKFAARYSMLVSMFRESVKKALADKALLTCWVADLVVAKEFFPRVISRIEQGHGAVFVLPLRAAAEGANEALSEANGALNDLELFRVGYENLHPLWIACLWDNPLFTKLPFTILWSSGSGLLARTFSTTPIVFKPTEEMLDAKGVIDVEIPHMCSNPYWASDWIEAPVIGVEPLGCYYPPFSTASANTSKIGLWAECLHKTQVPFLSRYAFYPSREIVSAPKSMLTKSDQITAMITATIETLGV